MKPASTCLANTLAGKYYAGQFNGTTGKVTAGSIAIPAGSLTIEAWIRKNAYSTQKSFFSNRGGSGKLYAGVTTKPFLFQADGTPTSFTGNATLVAGNEYHIVFTNDSVNTKCYVNGVLDKSAAGTIPASAGTIGIGWDPNVATEFWDGTIDELRVYGRALPAQEVSDHYNGIFQPIDPGLMARWSFDDGSSSTIVDSMGTLNGTVAGGVTFLDSNPYPGRTGKFVQCDLYTWALLNGSTAYFSSGDFDLKIGGQTYLSFNSLFKRGRTRSQLGTYVDNLDIEVFPHVGDQIAGLTWLQAAVAGAFDGARVTVERFVADSWNSVGLGKIYQFSGRVAGAMVTRHSLKIKLVSDLILLNAKIPRNLYQTTCVHTLYDAGCGLSRAGFTVIGTVTSGSTASLINSNLTQANNYFNLGALTFITGQNAGVSRSVDSFVNTGGVVKVPLPLPFAPLVGDTFSIYPGCNKVYTGDCLSKFANQARFKGTPFVPVPETAF